MAFLAWIAAEGDDPTSTRKGERNFPLLRVQGRQIS